MPWSPLQYTKEIFQKLKDWGHETHTSTQYLHKAIMMETMLIKPKTIGRVIKAFKMLGYISRKPNGSWSIHYWGNPKNIKNEVNDLERELIPDNETAESN